MLTMTKTVMHMIAQLRTLRVVLSNNMIFVAIVYYKCRAKQYAGPYGHLSIQIAPKNKAHDVFTGIVGRIDDRDRHIGEVDLEHI